MKFEIEYPIHSSVKILYARLSTLSGLSEWFADDVNMDKNGVYTFSWEGSEQQAILLGRKDEKFVRFQWLESEAEEFFEMKIQIDELTNDVSIIITDFADDEDDKEDSIQLWDLQIDNLKHVIGS